LHPLCQPRPRQQRHPTARPSRLRRPVNEDHRRAAWRLHSHGATHRRGQPNHSGAGKGLATPAVPLRNATTGRAATLLRRTALKRVLVGARRAPRRTVHPKSCARGPSADACRSPETSHLVLCRCLHGDEKRRGVRTSPELADRQARLSLTNPLDLLLPALWSTAYLLGALAP
jgi:hypothetical protein